MGNALDDKQYSLSPQAERVVAFGAVTGSFVLATSIFLDGVVSLYLYSSMNEELKLSLDGVNNWITLPEGPVVFIFDSKSNKAPIPGKYGIYVKNNGTPPASGSLYISAMTVI